MATEPSESEPTFTPPGSVAPAIRDFLGDDEIITQQEEAPQQREAWADQQDQPDEVVTANLLDLDEEGDGAAPGAPLAAEPSGRTC